MKKSLLLTLIILAFMLGMVSTVLADTVQVGTGTGTSSYLPLYGLYGYNYTQQIYTQAQIAKAGNITKIRFYYVSGTITNSKDWVVYMGHTTKTTFASTTDWEPLANLTQVFAGDVSSLVPLANNWMEITLTTPFAYDNVRNLVVAVDENTAGYSSMSWGAFTSGTNTGIYYYNDTTNPDPAAPPTANSRTATIDRIQFVFPNSAAPLAPTLVAPANGGWALSGEKLYWTPTAGGSDATTYDVYFGTAANPPLVSDNQTAANYTPTLAAATTYYWKVVASNEIGDSPASAIWSFKTPTATQVAESFENTTFPPAGWANGTTGTWSRSTSYFKHGTASAYKYGATGTAYVLSTPRVTITSTSTLDLWTLASGITGTLQVVYSPDRVTWTTIGAPITHAVAYTMYNSVIDLSTLAGNNYYLGIQTGLQAVSFYVDSVVGPEITPEAPGAPVLSVPADLAVNVNEYPTLTWTAPTTGGVPTGYKVYLDTNTTPTTQIGTVTGLTWTATTPLAYNTVYYWTVKATNGAGDSPAATVRSFTTRQDPTITSLPYTDGFEVDNTDATAVASWSNVYVTGTKNWTANSSVTTYNRAPRTGTFNAFLGWSASTWMIRPVQLTGGTSYDVEVYARQDDADVALANMTIAYGTAGTAAAMTNVIVPQTGLTNGDYQRLGGSFTPASTGIYYIGILGTLPSATNWYVSIDDITIRQTPANPSFSYAPTAIDFGMVQNAAQVGPQNVTVTNTGGGTLNLTAANLALSGANAAQFSFATTNLPAALGAGQSVVIPVYVTGTTAGPISATLTITYNATPYTVALSANVLPAGIVTVGNGTADLDLPINAYYGYTYSQSIFMQSELNTPDQRIEKVYYYWNGAAEATLSNDWTIYMGHTALTAFDTTTSWIPLANLSTVFTGTVALPAVAGWIEIPLTAPFVYNNTDNLVIAVDENTASYDGDSEFFFSTASATNRSLRYYNDTTNPDPAAPVAGTQVLGYPNVMLAFGDIPVGMPDPVTLTYPANEAAGLPIEGFNLTWTPALTGGVPTYYAVYMSMDVETIYDDFYWETTAQSFNPATAATTPVTFNYDERWYWTVQAFNASGDALVEPPFSFTIEAAPQIITTFPWVENFDAAAALPTDWAIADVDGGGTGWVTSTTYAHSAPNAFKHAYSTAVPEPGQDGWLITPGVAVPTGNYYLSWWNYNNFPTWMVYNGVKVNTTNNPADPNWVELWSNSTAASAWSQAVVSISAYVGQTVYFAFNYKGYDADDWYVDDVSVYELTVDTFGPIITHLPIINTPREDLSYPVYADILDDATWHNPVGGANMYWSIDGGTTWSAPVAMTTANDTTYVANIPAQPLGTTVTYKIEAWDSLNNMTTTSNFAFGVNDPTWVWYDQGGTTYLGYTTTDFGPTVLFENPFFGTDYAVQILATDGSSYYGNTANLQIWTYDGVNDLVPYFTTPIPVTFGAQTAETFDLTSYNVQITAPYFFVSYLDVPMGNYILHDGTYDYGTSFVYQGTTLYNMSNPGAWAIGAQVQTGALQALEAPVVTVALVAGVPTLSWTAIPGAGSYHVYGATNPYAADPWTPVDTTALTTYPYTGIDAYHFFKVTADSATPPVRGNVLSSQQAVRLDRLPVAPALRFAPNSKLTGVGLRK